MAATFMWTAPEAPPLPRPSRNLDADLHGPLLPGGRRVPYTGPPMGDRIRNMNVALDSSRMGRALKTGFLETFGWHFERGGFTGPGGGFQSNQMGRLQNLGFLGLRDSRQAFTARMANVPGASMFAKMRADPKLATRAGASFIGKTAFRSIGLLGTGYMAYSGYKEEGVWGATKGVAESIAWSAGMRMAGAAIGSAAPILGPAAILAAGVGLGYAVGEAGIAHAKQVRGVEFSAGDKMIEALSSHGAATMRQRSLMALNNTHVNGRMAIGNEALLMHTSF